ncbi:MAG: hypothetical protein NZ891_05075, partial [bacterium]|nr:hypothetical protein [bacterium]MDW8164096.1 hypothetical protein [Candidatus Omnitrophota bacterium]
MEEIMRWEEEVKNLEQMINRYLYLDEWKFKQELNFIGGERVDIDDKGWEIRKQPINWALKDGDTYLRKWVEVPKEIEGIKIEGSKILLKFVFPSGVTLYLNGKEVYSHQFWADKIATPFIITESAKPMDKFLIVFKTKKGDGLGVFWASISIENVDELIFQLKSVLYQLKFTNLIVNELKNKKLFEIIKECIQILDVKFLENRDWIKIGEVIENVEKKLEIFRPYAKKFKVHLIGH